MAESDLNHEDKKEFTILLVLFAKVQTNNRLNWSQYAMLNGVHLDVLGIFLSKARNDFLFINPNNLTMEVNLAKFYE